MKVDAHHHLWDLRAVSYPWIMDKTPRFFGDHAPIRRDYLIDEFQAECAPLGINASVHIQVGAADALAEARWIESVAEAHPDWPIVQVAFCDLADPDFEEVLAKLRRLRTLRGVRQIVGRSPLEDAKTGTNDLLENPRFLDGLKRLGELGLVFDLQLIPSLIPRVEELLSKAPDTKIALCHAASPHDRSPEGFEVWASHIKSLAALKNVSCKLSGFGMFDHKWRLDDLRPFFDICLKSFGEARLMFGSNFPVDKLSSSYAQLVARYEILAREAGVNGLFKNAVGFYDIKPV